MPYFQCFGTVVNIKQKMNYWASYLKKLVLLADSIINKEGYHGWPPRHDRTQDDEADGEIMGVLRVIPGCIGFHLCRAYIKNNARRYGLLDLTDSEYPTTEGIRKVNLEMIQWMQKQEGN